MTDVQKHGFNFDINLIIPRPIIHLVRFETQQEDRVRGVDKTTYLEMDDVIGMTELCSAKRPILAFIKFLNQVVSTILNRYVRWFFLRTPYSASIIT